MSVLKDNSGANAIEYALTMVFGAVFIIGGLLTLNAAMREPLTDMAVCLADAANCADVVTASGSDEAAGDTVADADESGGGEGGEGGGQGDD